jgi:hypothetical protein
MLKIFSPLLVSDRNDGKTKVKRCGNISPKEGQGSGNLTKGGGNYNIVRLIFTFLTHRIMRDEKLGYPQFKQARLKKWHYPLRIPIVKGAVFKNTLPKRILRGK